MLFEKGQFMYIPKQRAQLKQSDMKVIIVCSDVSCGCFRDSTWTINELNAIVSYE